MSQINVISWYDDILLTRTSYQGIYQEFISVIVINFASTISRHRCSPHIVLSEYRVQYLFGCNIILIWPLVQPYHNNIDKQLLIYLDNCNENTSTYEKPFIQFSILYTDKKNYQFNLNKNFNKSSIWYVYTYLRNDLRVLKFVCV